MAGLLAAGLSGCSTTSDTSTSADRTTVAIPLLAGEQQTEKSVSSTVGQTVEITLQGNSGTGYTWSMTAHSEGIQLENPPVTKSLEADTPGGPTVTTFELLMQKSGRQTARLELARTWEANTPAARVVDLVITVSEKP